MLKIVFCNFVGRLAQSCLAPKVYCFLNQPVCSKLKPNLLNADMPSFKWHPTRGYTEKTTKGVRLKGCAAKRVIVNEPLILCSRARRKQTLVSCA
jgi:hypothetical protein